MNYKKIFGNRKVRFKILHLLGWIPDKVMLRVQYRIKLGRWPNLRNPTRFTEKLQLYKMRYRNSILSQCVDKFEVRQYVEGKNLCDILVPFIGIYNDANEIDFEKLPERFVVKTTDGGGGNNVLVCNDKTKLDWQSEIIKINGWKNLKDINPGREWAYTGIKKSRIIVEDYIDGGERPLTDYKIFCFNGVPKFLYVVTDRKPGEYAYFGIYDTNFKKMNVYRCDERRAEQVEEMPKNFDIMLNIASKLSEDFPHVRVDLYNVNGKIYFGELTFYDGSGYFNYDPDSFDEVVGSYFTEY